MQQRKLGSPSTAQGEPSQAARLSWTGRRWHGLNKPYPVAGQNTGWCSATGSVPTSGRGAKASGYMFGMEPLSRFEGTGAIALFLVPKGEENPNPHIGEGTHR